MPTTPNTFVWYEIFHSDPRTIPFYAHTLGWEHVPVPMGDMTYTMFGPSQDRSVGGFRTGEPGERGWWLAYMAVDDVAESVARVREAGGQVLQDTTVLDPGTVAIVTEPTGGRFALWRSHHADTDSDPPRTLHSVHWTELLSTDVQRSLAFFQQALGLSHRVHREGNDAYILLTSGDTLVAGLMEQQPGKSSHWFNWVCVDDVQGAVDRALTHGGTLRREPWDQPDFGRIAIIADPSGGQLGLLTPPSAA